MDGSGLGATQPPPTFLEPVAFPSNYLGGFLRPYYVAEAIASRVLQTQAQLRAMGAFPGKDEALLCGAVMAARGLGSLGLPSELPASARLTVRVCMMHPPMPAAGEDPFLVRPPQRVNPQTTRRTQLYRTPPTSPDWAAGLAMWQAGPTGNPDLFVHSVGGGAGTWDYLKGYLLFQVLLEEEGSPPQPAQKTAFLPTSARPTSASAASAPRGATSTLVGQAILRICDLFCAASLPFLPSVSGLYHMLHGQGSSVKLPAAASSTATSGPGAAAGATPSSALGSSTSSSSAASASASAPSSTAAVVSASVASGDFPPRQEFFLRIWLPLAPSARPRTSSAAGGSAARRGGGGGASTAAAAAGRPPAILTTISLVLPRGILVPAVALVPPPLAPPSALMGMLEASQQQQQQEAAAAIGSGGLAGTASAAAMGGAGGGGSPLEAPTPPVVVMVAWGVLLPPAAARMGCWQRLQQRRRQQRRRQVVQES